MSTAPELTRLSEGLQAVFPQLHLAMPASFLHCMQRYWELRDFRGLQFAVRHADQEELADACRSLWHSPILNPDTPSQL